MTPSDPVLTIRTRFLTFVLHYVQSRGGDARALARRFELPPEHSDTEPVRWELLRDLSEAAERAIDEPFIGLRMAQANPRGSYGVFEFSAYTAPKVGDALARLVRYQSLVTDRTRFALRVTEDRSTIEHRIVGLPFGCGRHPNEFTVALLVRRVREILDPAFAPCGAYFGHDRPACVDELVEFFGTDNLVFAHPFNGISFARELLDRPMPTADPALLSVLDEHAKILVGILPQATDFLGSVRNVIQRDLLNGPPGVDKVADRLRMSVRTLQRRLRDCQTSFNELVDDVRHQLALQHLANETLSIGEITYVLGYSDTRAFHRAFRRWKGTTPAAYRRRNEPGAVHAISRDLE
ncbi:AraC family transcriptional regulator ligand-binding domain-containing protein [Pendulispora albinea]|uniref:AraC family transcriptional regulator n=1 Tax=Pendulispora albinea TaxID=2741071 RepID=A0ABZ2M1P6_9BACT